MVWFVFCFCFVLLTPRLPLADIVPIVMAGIIGIYGLVVSVLIANNLKQELALYTGFIQLGAGLAVGLAGLAAGYVSLGRFKSECETTRVSILTD